MATLLSHQIKEKINKNDMKYCRICADEVCVFGDKWTKPCKCKGSIEWVHLSCLMTWIKHSNKLTCDMCLTPYTFIYKTEKARTMCESILNYVNPKIAPLCFTVFVMLVLFDITYRFTFTKGCYTELYNFLKTYAFLMLTVFLILEMYSGTGFIDDLMEISDTLGYPGVLFVLPGSIYRTIRALLFNTVASSNNNEIIDVVNYT
jgi:E3 ubiquitin-protein ligase DOA10